MKQVRWRFAYRTYDELNALLQMKKTVGRISEAPSAISNTHWTNPTLTNLK